VHELVTGIVEYLVKLGVKKGTKSPFPEKTVRNGPSPILASPIVARNHRAAGLSLHDDEMEKLMAFAGVSYLYHRQGTVQRHRPRWQGRVERKISLGKRGS
jgi:hypothetical protein